MIDTRISRRAALMGAGAVAAWLTSPARALLQAVGRLQVPAFVDPLIQRMTLEEKAGQLQLMASAWGGGVALSLNPASAGPNFQQQIEEARRVLYVGMTRAKERLVLTRAEHRGGRPTGGIQFLDEMKLVPLRPSRAPTLSVVLVEAAPAPL